MSPITHFLSGWLLAETMPQLTRRERAMITIAAVAPDFDGLGVIADFLTRQTANPLQWYATYHHTLGHNLVFSALLACLATMLSDRQRLLTGTLTFLAVHLHLLCDLAGSRSPDGYDWPIPWLYPYTNAWQWRWSGQWELNAWPNFVITGIALLITFALAIKRGYSPLEILSIRADHKFVQALQQRFS